LALQIQEPEASLLPGGRPPVDAKATVRPVKLLAGTLGIAG
jgi:hypothetical protein